MVSSPQKRGGLVYNLRGMMVSSQKKKKWGAWGGWVGGEERHNGCGMIGEVRELVWNCMKIVKCILNRVFIFTFLKDRK